MDELAQVVEIFLEVTPVVFTWIRAAVKNDADAARGAMFKTANVIADVIERQKFGVVDV